MENKNCLEHRRCPRCGQERSIEVEAVKWVTVYDNGLDCDGDTFYDGDSAARCDHCEYEGKWKDFCIDRQEREKGLTNEQRAELAAHGLDAYAIKKAGKANYDTPVDIAEEMIADLLHLIRAHDSDAIKALGIARREFEAQQAREEKGGTNHG